MGKIRYLLPTIVLVLSACGGESDTSGPADDDLGSGNPESPAVASIVVEGPVVMLWDAGVSTRLTASALGSLGQVIPGVTFEWISVDPSVAVVEGGVVTTVGDGWTEALASAQGESGGVSIVVVTPDGPRDRTDCIACHADSYTGRHGGTNTPETCLQCHTGPTWTGGDFDHPSVANGFELLGAHSLTSCAACHEADGSPRYPGVADDQCIACHQDDYDGRHGGSNTPTTCLTCHTRDSFSGADFDHDAAYFPISSGKHQGKWSGCATCHVDPSDYTDFSCFACHVHDQNRMDDKHSERAGYAYDSDLCYACHPRGKAE
jgi:hypothetical protein